MMGALSPVLDFLCGSHAFVLSLGLRLGSMAGLEASDEDGESRDGGRDWQNHQSTLLVLCM